MTISSRTLANAIRALSMDAVQKANSGHPGMPMGMADIAEVLWRHFLQHNPNSPHWPNRDRFILSNGHGSMLQYSLLHLTGYDLTIEDLQHFRQLHSRTAGHPEYGITPGVETTTGPLGQGIANAVGMALAEKMLATQYNREGLPIIDHHTYVFLGDGCLMEGISHEVCSLAGTWKLGKLIAFWDDNGISIDGEVQDWFTDNTPKRFEAYGWQVIADVDGHDSEAIANAIRLAQADSNRPTIICCKTTIGFGAPTKAGTAGCHGSPLGESEIAAAKQQLNWPYASFEIPKEIYTAWNAVEAGEAREAKWQDLWQQYQATYPELAAELARRWQSELPEDWPLWVQDGLQKMQASAKTMATRKASELVLEYFGPKLPELLGGSADLTGSNNTKWSGAKAITPTDFSGRYIYYGVREFGMCAIMNGLALYGGFIPYGGTFLVFSDYARNAIRLAALMKQRNIFVLTHDSIGLGEDGPTHQPVEHLASLRLIPNLQVWRPCDLVETYQAWVAALESHEGPAVLALSRQNLPAYQRDEQQAEHIRKGGYILSPAKKAAQLSFIATGSEVHLAMAAQTKLWEEGFDTQVISMPCVEAFIAQPDVYQAEVLSAHIPTLVVEAGSPDLWPSVMPGMGAVLGINRFGESAPAEAVFNYLGFTVDNVVAMAKDILKTSDHN